MEYTKDIVLDINCKKERKKGRIDRLKEILYGNKIIISAMLILINFVSIDMILVNSFLELFNKLY